MSEQFEKALSQLKVVKSELETRAAIIAMHAAAWRTHFEIDRQRMKMEQASGLTFKEVLG